MMNHKQDDSDDEFIQQQQSVKINKKRCKNNRSNPQPLPSPAPNDDFPITDQQTDQAFCFQQKKIKKKQQLLNAKNSMPFKCNLQEGQELEEEEQDEDEEELEQAVEEDEQQDEEDDVYPMQQQDKNMRSTLPNKRAAISIENDSNTHQSENLYVDSLTSFPSALKLSNGAGGVFQCGFGTHQALSAGDAQLKFAASKQYTAFSSSINSAINYFETKPTFTQSSSSRAAPIGVGNTQNDEISTPIQNNNNNYNNNRISESDNQFLIDQYNHTKEQLNVYQRRYESTQNKLIHLEQKFRNQSMNLIAMSQENQELRRQILNQSIHINEIQKQYYYEKSQKEENYQILTNFVNQYTKQKNKLPYQPAPYAQQIDTFKQYSRPSGSPPQQKQQPSLNTSSSNTYHPSIRSFPVNIMPQDYIPRESPPHSFANNNILKQTSSSHNRKYSPGTLVNRSILSQQPNYSAKQDAMYTKQMQRRSSVTPRGSNDSDQPHQSKMYQHLQKAHQNDIMGQMQTYKKELEEKNNLISSLKMLRRGGPGAKQDSMLLHNSGSPYCYPSKMHSNNILKDNYTPKVSQYIREQQLEPTQMVNNWSQQGQNGPLKGMKIITDDRRVQKTVIQNYEKTPKRVQGPFQNQKFKKMSKSQIFENSTYSRPVQILQGANKNNAFTKQQN